MTTPIAFDAAARAPALNRLARWLIFGVLLALVPLIFFWVARQMRSQPSDLHTVSQRALALPRPLAALVLVLLLGATGLVFTTSRPLADVDIEAVSLTDPRCQGSEPCPGPLRAPLRGTAALRPDETRRLVKSASGEWSVAAEAQSPPVSSDCA